MRAALWSAVTIAALLTLFVVSVFLRYPLDRDIAVRRAGSPELTARIDPANGIGLSHFEAHPFNANLEAGMWVRYEDLNPLLVQAVLEKEDRHFRNPLHFGINLPACLGAAWEFVRKLTADGPDPLQNSRGCSGIEQQTAKQLYSGSERAESKSLAELALAKADEAVIAMWLDTAFSKEEILEMYLNVSFFGQGNRGVEAAVRSYFGYSFKKVGSQSVAFTPLMAASLAVTLKAPSEANPSKPANLERAKWLLRVLNRRGLLSDDELKLAEATKRLPLLRGAGGEPMPRYLFHVRDPAVLEVAALKLNVPERNGVLRVSLFSEGASQLQVEKALARHPELGEAGYDVSVYVVNNLTGGVEALYQPQLKIYPASLVKPFIALCMAEHGIGPGDLVRDEPVGNPPVRNSDRDYLGNIPLAEALAKSRNPPFVTATARYGRDCVNQAIARLGGTPWFPVGEPRLAGLGGIPVGTAALLQSYVALATCGAVSNAPDYVQEVRFGNRSLYSGGPTEVAMQPEERSRVQSVINMMRGAARPGGTAAGLIWGNIEVAAKTGTASENRQVSIVTITSYYTVLVTAFARPGGIRSALTSGSLVPLAFTINANLHIPYEDDPLPLGCGQSPPELARAGLSAPGL